MSPCPLLVDPKSYGWVVFLTFDVFGDLWRGGLYILENVTGRPSLHSMTMPVPLPIPGWTCLQGEGGNACLETGGLLPFSQPGWEGEEEGEEPGRGRQPSVPGRRRGCGRLCWRRRQRGRKKMQAGQGDFLPSVPSSLHTAFLPHFLQWRKEECWGGGRVGGWVAVIIIPTEPTMCLYSYFL